MKAIRFVVLAALLAAFGSPAHAAEQTLEGTLVCAKCYMKKADAHECQDVLLVPTANGGKSEYYVKKNEVAEQAGEAGRIWVTPSKIERLPTASGGRPGA